MISSSSLMPSSVEYMLEFHTVGTLISAVLRAARIVCMLGTGSPPTKFTLAVPSRRSLVMTEESCPGLMSRPLVGSREQS